MSTHRIVWRFLAVVTLAVSAVGLTTVVAAPAGATAHQSLRVTSLAFAEPYVDTTEGPVVVTLDFSVEDTNPAATHVQGEVNIRLADRTPGAYLGQTHEILFNYGDSGIGDGFADWVSGTPQHSSYRYSFAVPRFANVQWARWQVTAVTAQDNVGGSVTIDRSSLHQFHRSTLVAKSLVDTVPPSLDRVEFENPVGAGRPYAYVGGRSAEVRHRVDLLDQHAGFWHGRLTMTGPGGASIVTDFVSQVEDGARQCGYYSPFEAQSGPCGVLLSMPAGAAAGAWRVSAITLVDNAGNTATFTDIEASPVVVTSNDVVSASGFTATPNPVNNWAGDVDIDVAMAVHGAQQGVSEIHIDLATVGGFCSQRSTTPTANPDGTFSVPVRAFRGVSQCVVEGITIVDGAGNAALYGSQYEAPDPGITIMRLPNTTPPTVTAASLSPTSIPIRQPGDDPPQVVLTAQVDAPIAPVTGYDLSVFDAAGETVAQQFGGTGTSEDGTLRLFFSLEFGVPAGEYTVGFRIRDASGLSSAYGLPGSPPVPGGPLILTVTPA